MIFCETCKYLYHPSAEDNYTECAVFGDCEPPNEYITECGCNCSQELLEKILQKNENAWAKECDAFVKWHLEHDNNKQT